MKDQRTTLMVAVNVQIQILRPNEKYCDLSINTSKERKACLRLTLLSHTNSVWNPIGSGVARFLEALVQSFVGGPHQPPLWKATQKKLCNFATLEYFGQYIDQNWSFFTNNYCWPKIGQFLVHNCPMHSSNAINELSRYGWLRFVDIIGRN